MESNYDFEQQLQVIREHEECNNYEAAYKLMKEVFVQSCLLKADSGAGMSVSTKDSDTLNNHKQCSGDEIDDSMIKHVPQAMNLKVDFTDVLGYSEVKNALREILIYQSQYPNLVPPKTSTSVTGILLYGPPGTGKTHFVQALAGEMSVPLYNLNPSEFNSKWKGESEKILVATFESASKHEKSIIFVDEVDCLMSNKNVTDDSSTGIRAILLSLLDGILAKRNVIFVGTTNHPQKIDDAFLSRLHHKIFVSVPDADTRKEMLGACLINIKHENLNSENVNQLVIASAGLTGREFCTLRDTLRYQALRTAKSSHYFKRIYVEGEMFYSPVDKKDKDTVTCNWEDIVQNILPRPIKHSELRAILGSIQPAASREMNHAYTMFGKRFGAQMNSREERQGGVFTKFFNALTKLVF